MAQNGGARPGAGRKKGFAALEAEKSRLLIAEKLSTNLAPIVDKAIKQAKNGDRAAREWLMDRAYGRPKSNVDLTSDGEKIETGVVVLPAKRSAPKKVNKKSNENPVGTAAEAGAGAHQS